jgi:curved DNA-binding protein CbpA
MKLESKYFDSIRIAPDLEARARAELPECQWQGCCSVGAYRAPMGRGREGRYFRFCLSHVREFNQSYNYFEGMSDEDVAAFQKDAVTGHRPTWKMGVNSAGPGASEEASRAYADMLKSRRSRRWRAEFFRGDPYGVFGEDEGEAQRGADNGPQRTLRNLERRALDALGLAERASKKEIKARFKELVKRHHPDRNGGDRSSEEKLRDIIQAYNYLKQAGLV